MLPKVYPKVTETKNNPKLTFDESALIINQDSNITSRILKIANSAFFRFASEINSVNWAIFIIGQAQAQLHGIVLASSAVAAFKGIISDLVNMKDFWLHSVYCAKMQRNRQ